MSELFSGQMTTSGCASPAVLDGRGQLERLLHVVVEDGAALGVEVQARARHVALDHRDGRRRAAVGERRGRAAAARRGPDQRARPARRRPRGRRRGPPAPAPPASSPAARRGAPPGAHQGRHRRGQQGTGQGDGEAHQRHAAVRRQRHQRALGLAEPEPAPGEATEGHAPAQHLVGHPQRRRPQRPERQPGGQRRRAAEQGEERRLHQREGEPRDRADVGAGPGEQRHEEGQAEDETEPEAGAEAPAVDGEREGRGAERRQRGQVVAREREQQQEATRGGERGAPGPTGGRASPEPAGSGPAGRGSVPVPDAGPSGAAGTHCLPGTAGVVGPRRSDAGPDRCAVAAVLTQHPIPPSRRPRGRAPVPGPSAIRVSAGAERRCGSASSGRTAGRWRRSARPLSDEAVRAGSAGVSRSRPPGSRCAGAARPAPEGTCRCARMELQRL